jgi:hypothetical protein
MAAGFAAPTGTYEPSEGEHMAITTEPSEAFTTLPDDEVLADTVVALEEGGFSWVQPKSDRHTVLVSPVGPFVGPNAPICTFAAAGPGGTAGQS